MCVQYTSRLKVGFSLGDALEINQCDPANATADLEADPRAGINIEGASFHNVGGNGVTIIGGLKAPSTPVSIAASLIFSLIICGQAHGF